MIRETSAKLSFLVFFDSSCPMSTSDLPRSVIVHFAVHAVIQQSACRFVWGQSAPFPSFIPLVDSLPHLLLFFYFSLFPFLIRFISFLLLTIPSLSTRIVPFRFQAGGRRKRPNLGLVCLCLFCVICTV